MTLLVGFTSLSLAFFFTGSTSKLFHMRMVSSPAIVAMVEQSGLRVKLRTLSWWPEAKSIDRFNPCWSIIYGCLEFTAYFPFMSTLSNQVEVLTIQLYNFREGGVLPDDYVVGSVAMGRD